MNKSSRHHYIPEFFIKGFADRDSKLFVFDLKEKRFKVKKFSPKQIFFEWNRNTFEVNNEETDFLETSIYKWIDNRFSKFFEEIRDSDELMKINLWQLMHLQLFVAHIFWRIPRTDGEMQRIFEYKSPKELGFTIKNIDTQENASKEFYDEIMKEGAFIEAYRSVFPVLEHIQDDPIQDIDNWYIYGAPKESGFHICGDNPVITVDDRSMRVLQNELIFPLTKNHIIIRLKKNTQKPQLSPELIVKINLVIFLQSNRYVCGSRKDFIDALNSLAGEYKKEEQLEKLKKEIFNEIR